MKKKKKKLISLAEKVRRDNEIKETGKLVSLRPYMHLLESVLWAMIKKHLIH